MREGNPVPSLLNEIEDLTLEVEGLLSDGCFQEALTLYETRDQRMRELFLNHGDQAVNQFFPNYLKCVSDNKYLRDRVIPQKHRIIR